VISIVIPAHNEGRVIERCLTTILADAAPGEFEIAVVCNGCNDDTATRARGFGADVKVVETPIGSKIHALNLGDKAVSSFPRFYVDADIQLSTGAIRDVAQLLGDDSPVVVAAPRAVVNCDDRPWTVRAFYDVWTRLPYFKENMVGSGVYAFSRNGRARFGEFPQVTADDEFARHIAAPHERRASPTSTFTIYPPRTVRDLLKIMTRTRAADIAFRKRFPDLQVHGNTSPRRSVRIIATTPSMWLHAPVYLGVMLLARRRALQKLRTQETTKEKEVWERDDSSRQ
jgi:glycosyltransferase involved in cell wall biosynthesis